MIYDTNFIWRIVEKFLWKYVWLYIFFKLIFFSPSGPENKFTRFASGVIFSSFIVLFTFDGVVLCSSDGQSFDLTIVIKNAILNPEFVSMMSTLLTKSTESSIKTAIFEASVGLHKKNDWPSLLQRTKDWVSRLSGCGCCHSFIKSIFSPSGPENKFTRFASGVILSWDLLTIVSKLVCTTVVYFKMATPSNVNKTINDEKITSDAKRVNLFHSFRETFPQSFK
jgi:hypothetical protein